MANTVSLLSYANTFGDWVQTTNQLVGEVDNLGKGNYTKDSGLLTINSPGTGLQVSNNALFTGNVLITGAGQSLQVTHDTIISGNLTVLGNTTIAINELSFGDISSNTIHANVATLGSITISTDANITGNLTVGGNTTINLNEVVSGNLSANQLLGNANTKIYQGIADSANAAIATALAFSIALG
jgi:hypothetical protein